MTNRREVVHWNRGDDRTACGRRPDLVADATMTVVKDAVDCGNCMRSLVFQGVLVVPK